MPIGREISVMNQVGYKELFLRDVMSGQSETKIKRPSVTPMEMTQENRKEISQAQSCVKKGKTTKRQNSLRFEHTGSAPILVFETNCGHHNIFLNFKL